MSDIDLTDEQQDNIASIAAEVAAESAAALGLATAAIILSFVGSGLCRT